ncbi:Contactin [Mizuhopecten yessoensis]|uniref:Contactin n=2 Tax=Mizuhopecten yessoensis TaxID=6573 RepID=A0A210PTR2_MIZYE|nr:Contactin [Mizuhopecten yessoensis]
MATGDLQWKGDGTRIQPADQYWLNVQEMFRPGLHIVYTYAVLGYLWGREVESSQLPYICEIIMNEAYRIAQTQRDYAYGTGLTDPVLAPRGPDMIIQPTSLVAVGEAVSASFECVATGNPAPTYTIVFIDEQNNRTVISPEVDPRYTITNGKVTIQHPNERNDSGTYQCIAENKFGSILGNTMYFTFGSLGSFSNVDRAPVEVFSHESAQIECDPPINKPAITYQWLRRRTGSYVRPDLTPYIFISRNGKLYFSVVSKNDEDEYFCIVELTSNNGAVIGTNQPPSRTSLPIQLTVTQQVESLWGPEIVNEFPAVYPSRPVRGQNLYLECLAYGSMPIEYSWSREILPMPRTVRILDHNRVLLIEGAQIEDGGTYTCHATRGFGIRVEKSFNFTIEAKPFFSYPLSDRHVDIGSQLTWRCEAKAYPTPTYTWYKNGVKLSNVPGEINIVKNVMRINNIDPEKHNGMYQCSATNVYGEVFTEGQLRVLAFPPTFVKRPLEERMFAAIGGNATIICDPEAAPFPTFTWRRNGADLGLSHGDMTSRIRMLQNGNLFIQNVAQGDAGLYLCSAENTYGSASSSGTLYVTSSTVINVLPQPTSVYVNNTAFLACSASVSEAIEFIQTWTFNEEPIDLDNDLNYALGASQNIQGLYIRHAQFKHSGDYECVVMTTMDRSSASARLTVLGPPGPPAGVYADPTTITTNAVRIKWSVGALNGLPVDFYMVEARTELGHTWTVVVPFIADINTIVPGSNKHVIEVTGLKPGVGYIFRVSAANSLGIGEPSKPSDIFQTLQAAPSVAPANVGGGGGSVGDLTLTWLLLADEDWGGAAVSYTVYWRAAGSTSDASWVKETLNSPDVGKHVQTIGQEYYYSPYEVKVQAHNEFGKGPNSSIALVYSAEDLPVAVATNIQAWRHNSTAILVVWDPIPDEREIMRGKLLGYQVNYFERNDSNPIINSISWRTTDPQGLVIGLMPYTWYTFDVQVLNTAGMGQISEKIHQRTYQNAPLLYPTEVHVHSHGANSALVTWRGVSTGVYEEPLQGFKVRYWLSNDNIRTAKDVIVDKVDQTVIYGLEKDNLYKLRILGYSQGGDGNLGETVYFTLGGMVYVDPSVSEIRASADRSTLSITALLISVMSAIVLL